MKGRRRLFPCRAEALLLVLVPYPLQAETFLPDICQAGKSAEQRQRDAHADIFVHVILQLVFDRDDLAQVIPFRVVVTGIEAEFRLMEGEKAPDAIASDLREAFSLSSIARNSGRDVSEAA